MIYSQFHRLVPISLIIVLCAITSTHSQMPTDLDDVGTSGIDENYNYDYYDNLDKSKNNKEHNDVNIYENNKNRNLKHDTTTLVVTTAKSNTNLSDYDYYDKEYDYNDDYKDEDYFKDDRYDIDVDNQHQFIGPVPDVNSGSTQNQLSTTSTKPATTQKTARSKLLAIMAKPGILAGIVGGAIIGVLTAILLIMFIVYRMKKKDEGSYALEETKKPLNAYDYRHCPTKEFYA
jgi:hypothetical protein